MKTLLPSGVSTVPVLAVRWNAGPLVQTIPSLGMAGAAAAGGIAYSPSSDTSARKNVSLRRLLFQGRERLGIRLTHPGLGRERRALGHPDLRGHSAPSRPAGVGQLA